jgi:L-lactate dehydrogenase complex protein LldG
VKRDAFLRRVQQAAEAGRAYRVADREGERDVGYVGASGPLAETLAAEVNANGGTSHLVPREKDAQEVVVQLAREQAPHAALCWKHPLLERLGMEPLLSEQGIACWNVDSLSQLPPEEQRRRILSAELGITSADLAVAETGSLVVGSAPGQERVASLLPPFHIAVVEESQIVADLFDVFQSLHARGDDALPSNLVFISGPSKTGDIAMQLTVGVHGPGQWHVVIIANGEKGV